MISLPSIRHIYKGEYKLVLEDCLLVNNSQCEEVKIIFTSYRLALVSPAGIKLNLPFGYINKLSRSLENKPVVCSYIEISTKYGIDYKLKFLSSPDISDRIFNIIGKSCYCTLPDVFAYDHCSAQLNKEDKIEDPILIAERNGWIHHDILKEYERMGLQLKEKNTDYPWTLVSNTGGKLCLSYPEALVIPSGIGEDSLSKCLKYRSKERVPALSYAYLTNK